jgi:hypothetical protein
MLDFPVELSRTNELLERIANALDRINPPLDAKEPEPYVPRKTEPQDIRVNRLDPEAPAMKRLREIERRLELPR